MFRREDNVFCAGVFENFRPYGRVPLLAFRVEGLSEAVVVVICAVVLLVVGLRRRTVDPDGVVVPLGIGVVFQEVRLLEVDQFERRPSRDRIKSPVDEMPSLASSNHCGRGC